MTPFAKTRSGRLIKALAEQYHVLPSDVLRRTPGELYLDLVLTFAKEDEARPPRPRAEDDPSLTHFLRTLKAGRDG